ncbi:MAG: C40 family peptidase [Bacteroidales bacterium]|nr:C40 family peptidase [Bacteroidales bacterium]
MKIGICEIAYIPLRGGMSHKSEMVSQILFGEIYEITIHRSDWSKVRLIHDNYEGWIDSSMIKNIEEVEDLDKDYIFKHQVCKENTTLSCVSEKGNMSIPTGSIIPLKLKDALEFSIGDNKYKLETPCTKNKTKDKRKIISQKAIEMLNTPYLWGGRTEFGIDCSGFSQLLYRLAEINIPRDASKQISIGHTLNFLSEAQAGDLAFFDNDEGEIVHVGIILDGSQIIHASGKVRIDTIDHQGIYNKTIKRYTHNLRVIKSLIHN